MLTEKEISGLLKYGERITLECKKAKNSIPNSVWETYSAFANTSGGVILLGVEENFEDKSFKKFTITNIENSQARLKEFWDTIHNPSKVNKNLLFDSNVGVCTIDDKTIIWIEVPPADYTQKPVFINGNPINGTFKRNFEGDYHCKESEVASMFRDSKEEGNDSAIMDGYSTDDIDPETLKSYRILFTNKNPDHVWNKLDDKTFLQNLGGYAIDRQTQKEGLTLAGLLMFGKGISIRECFDNIRMDFIDKTGIEGDMRWSDRLTYDGNWENNLCNFLWMVTPKLMRDIKRPFKLDGITRVDDTAVHKAIRESIVNMLIHADYRITGVLKIVKEDNGFWFSNPGSLKLPIRRIYEGGNSKARNPRIQTMLRMIGYGDNVGSGFPTILDAWQREKWRKPNLYEDAELQQVNLKLFTVSLMPEECTSFFVNLLGRKHYSKLTSEEQIILGTAYLEKSVSNQRLQQIFDIHPTDIGKILSGLVDKGLLFSENKGRWTTYAINEEYKKPSEQLDFSDIENLANELKNESDKLILDFVRSNGFITTSQVVAITKINTLQGALNALKRMIKRGLIIKQGIGRKTHYVIAQKVNLQ